VKEIHVNFDELKEKIVEYIEDKKRRMKGGYVIITAKQFAVDVFGFTPSPPVLTVINEILRDELKLDRLEGDRRVNKYIVWKNDKVRRKTIYVDIDEIIQKIPEELSEQE